MNANSIALENHRADGSPRGCLIGRVDRRSPNRLQVLRAAQIGHVDSRFQLRLFNFLARQESSRGVLRHGESYGSSACTTGLSFSIALRQSVALIRSECVDPRDRRPASLSLLLSLPPSPSFCVSSRLSRPATFFLSPPGSILLAVSEKMEIKSRYGNGKRRGDIVFVDARLRYALARAPPPPRSPPPRPRRNTIAFLYDRRDCFPGGDLPELFRRTIRFRNEISCLARLSTSLLMGIHSAVYLNCRAPQFPPLYIVL